MTSSALHGCNEASVREVFSLLKPGVMSLVVFTGYVGMAMAPGTLHPLLQVITVLCIALGSGAGAAINMWYDRDIDAIMQRTRTRPIPSGKIAPEDALILGVLLAFFSVSILGLAVGWAAAGLLAFAIWFYGCAYTMLLKRHTDQNIVIGGAAGAFPPVIGWLAVMPVSDISWDPVLYFLIIFLWTPPHFWALALYRHGDYAKASIPMLPVTAGEKTTKRRIFYYTLALVIVSLLPSLPGQSGLFYITGATLLGGLFIYRSYVVWHSDYPKDAMRLFFYSILYLFLLFSLLLIDKLVDIPLRLSFL